MKPNDIIERLPKLMERARREYERARDPEDDSGDMDIHEQLVFAHERLARAHPGLRLRTVLNAAARAKLCSLGYDTRKKQVLGYRLKPGVAPAKARGVRTETADDVENERGRSDEDFEPVRVWRQRTGLQARPYEPPQPAKPVVVHKIDPAVESAIYADAPQPPDVQNDATRAAADKRARRAAKRLRA